MRQEVLIDAALPELVELLKQHSLVCLEAPPGTGKTTRVPLALMQAFPGQILVLEPRRLAARWAAGYVAASLGQSTGQDVGYQVRFEDRTQPGTRVVYLTQGVFARKLLSPRAFAGVDVVILDEFHERSLDNDLALAWLRSQKSGPRVLIMSATLPAALEAELRAPKLHCQAVAHPVKLVYMPEVGEIEQKVAQALQLHAPTAPGQHSLIFLPGMREIRACQRRLENLAIRRNAEIMILHGSLTTAEQDLVLTPSPRGNRWILSTNLAESSLTVPGVRAVFDSGWARTLSSRPTSPVPKLELTRISRHSAVQRAGRAGRLGPGLCVRLYAEGDFAGRPESDPPEILQADLAPLRLLLKRLGDPALAWLDPPEAQRWAAAEALLVRLGALVDGALSPLGRRMAEMPVHPRLARLLLGCADPLAAVVATLLGERIPLDSPTDVMHLPSRLVELARRLPAHRQLAVRGGDETLAQALLNAFPDLVAQVRRGSDLLLCEGGSARLAPTASGQPPMQHEKLVIALDLEENWGSGGRAASLRLYASVEPEQLLERPELVESVQLDWNPTLGRVEQSDRLGYGQLILEEQRRPAVAGPEAARILAGEAQKSAWFRGLQPALTALEQRLVILARLCPELDCQLDRAAWLEQCCEGFTSLRQLEERYSGAAIQPTAGLPKEVGRALHQLCPPFVKLGSRILQVHYDEGNEPWVASKLVDFFNHREGPSIGEGRLPLTLHLLAPNQRPVQITRDLAGFWVRHYPSIRKELCRRYPRHPWPEDPLHAPTDWRPQRK